MISRYLLLAVAALTVTVAGCKHSYEYYRPPVDQLDERDRGLQSKELVVVTDQMAASLLSLPELGQSGHQWTIVATYMQNQTATPGGAYDMFIDRLKTNLAKHGRGRVSLIENRARYRDLQSREIETGGDEFGQGSGASGLPAGIQPDYFLYGKMQELPNRGTSTYRAEFNLTNAKTRQIVWSDEYIVRVAR